MLLYAQDLFLLTVLAHVFKGRLFDRVEQEFEVFALDEMFRQLVHSLDDKSKLFKGLIMIEKDLVQANASIETQSNQFLLESCL